MFLEVAVITDCSNTAAMRVIQCSHFFMPAINVDNMSVTYSDYCESFFTDTQYMLWYCNRLMGLSNNSVYWHYSL